MFNKLINKLAQSIANATSTTGKVNATPEQLAQVKTLTIPRDIRTRMDTPREYTSDIPMVGRFTVGHLDLLHSTYLRDALAGLGAWSALARAFSEYAKQTTSARVTKDFTKYEQAKDEFHQWNAATSNEKQMDADSVVIALDRIAEVPVPKGNEQTDAIIARVRKTTVEDVQQKRLALAERQTAQRKEMIGHLAADIWDFEQGEDTAYIMGSKAVLKAIQTMEWIANTWSGDPANVAGEILLIEADLKMLEAIARDERNHEEESQI